MRINNTKFLNENDVASRKIHGTLIKLDCQKTCLCVLKEDVKGLWPDLTANNKPNKNKIFHTSASSSLCAGSSDCGVCLISLFGSLYILTQWGIIVSCYCCSTVLASGTRDHVNYNSIDQEIRICMLFNSMSRLIWLGIHCSSWSLWIW